MSKKCAKCDKTVYPVEELKCLEKVWHKACFKCQECGMTLNMKNYKGFDKLPYCGAHVPKAKATVVADTPENARLAANSKAQSTVQYHAEFEASRGKFTAVTDDPETMRLKANSDVISNISYHDIKGQKIDQEKKRSLQGGGENTNQTPEPEQKVLPTLTEQSNMNGGDNLKQTIMQSNHQPPKQQYPQQPTHHPQQVQDTRPNSVSHNSVNKPASRSTPPIQQPPTNYNMNQQRPQMSSGAVPPPYANPPQQPAYQQPPQYHPQQQKQRQQQLQQQQLQQQQLQQQQLQQQQLRQQQLQQQQLRQQQQHLQQQQARHQGEYGQKISGGGQPPYQKAPSGHGQYPQHPPNNGYGGAPPYGHQPGQQQMVDPRRTQQQQQPPPSAFQAPPGAPTNGPSSARGQSARCYQAMYDYESQDSDEVSFRDGDIIINAAFIDEGWMTGTVHRTGQSGMLPANYVEPVNL